MDTKNTICFACSHYTYKSIYKNSAQECVYCSYVWIWPPLDHQSPDVHLKNTARVPVQVAPAHGLVVQELIVDEQPDLTAQLSVCKDCLLSHFWFLLQICNIMALDIQYLHSPSSSSSHSCRWWTCCPRTCCWWTSRSDRSTFHL